nr:hypothetical protein Iba_chr11aCG3590 [Ipomoea batatas]
MIRCIGEMNSVPMHGVSRARAYVSAIGPARFRLVEMIIPARSTAGFVQPLLIESDPFCSEPDDPFNSVNNCGDDVRNESPSLFNRPSLAEEGEIVVPAKFSEYEKRILLEALRRISRAVDVRLEPLQLFADRRFEIGGANVPLRKKILVARCRSSDGKINAVSERTVGVQVSVNEREIESGSDEIDDQAAVGEASCGFTEEGRGGDLAAMANGKRMKTVRTKEEAIAAAPALSKLSYRLTNDNLRNAMIRCIGEMNAVPMHGVSRARAYVSAVGSARFGVVITILLPDRSAAGFVQPLPIQSDPLCSELDDPFNSVNNCGDDVRDESSNLFNRPSLAEEREIVVPAKFSEDEKRILEAIRARSGGLEGRFEMILEPLQLLADRRFGIGGANVPLRKKPYVERRGSGDGEINSLSE